MLRWQTDVAAQMRLYGQVSCPPGPAPHQFKFEDLAQDPKSSVVFEELLNMGQEVVAFNKCHDMSPERAKATFNVVK